jgi:single-stranded-DNA-specific exonuclease
MVRRGLLRLSERPRLGLAALLETARWHGQLVTAEDIAFQLAPRINAAGRIDSPRHALSLLLTSDPNEARQLAYRLDELNRRRRELEQRMTEEALRDAELWLRHEKPGALVLASEHWHLGVVGISAARIAQSFGLPAVVLAIEGDEARGSARSFGGLDLKAALDRCADHLLRYGGHADAAGMTLRRSAIDGFRSAFAAAAAAMSQPAPAGRLLDATVELSEFEPGLVDFLERFGPFGAGHPAPVFASFGLLRLGEPRLVGERHLKLHVRGAGKERSFIGFSMAETYLANARLWPSLDLAYRVRYRANSPYDPWELELVDLRQAERPPDAMTAV